MEAPRSVHSSKSPGSRFTSAELGQRSGRRWLATIVIALGALFAVLCPSASAQLPAAPNTTVLTPTPRGPLTP